MTRTLFCAVAALLGAVVLAGCEAGAAGAPAPAAASGPSLVVARGLVELPTGPFELMAPQDGLVAMVHVQEGDLVRAGQPLLRLDGEAQRHEQAMAEAELGVARARLQAQQARLPAAEQLLQRTERAVQADALEPQRADEARQALAEQRGTLGVAQAELALAQARLAQAQAAARRLVLTAPTDGQVLKLQVQAGSRVAAQAGRPLLLLLPTQALRVRAELNEAWVARVKPGQAARVLADGDLPASATATAYAARVQRLAPLFGASRLDPDAQPRAQLRVLDCYLVFDGPTPLRAGQAVRVEFPQ